MDIFKETFLRLDLIKTHQPFQNFLKEHAPEPHSISVADIIISI